MRKSININIFATLLLLTVSCQKPSTPPYQDGGDEIAFQVIAPESVVTRSEIDQAYLQNTIKQVTLFAKEGGKNMFNDSTILAYTGSSIWSLNKNWKNDVPYEFYAYVHTPVPSGAKLQTKNLGKTVIITQPPTDYKNAIDFLISHKAYYKASSNHQIVPLVLEHAMSKITLIIEKAQTMTGTLSDVKVEFVGVRSKTTMNLQKHKLVDDEKQERNEWTFTPGGVAYTYTTVIASTNIPNTGSNQDGQMTFIAIPADNAAMTDFRLKISYNYEGKLYNNVFDLSTVRKADGTLLQWDSAHHVKYRFKIDNGVRLEGEIKPWVDVDYIEGTILPPIKEELNKPAK